MNLSDVTNLEIDITTLGIDFEVLNPVEYEDSDEYIGVQIVKLFSKPLERILISSLDVELLKENFSEIFDDYEIEFPIRLTLDYQEDYWLMNSLVRILDNYPNQEEIINFFNLNPDLYKINWFRNDDYKSAQVKSINDSNI